MQAIHGGVRRADRRQITEEFTKNPACQMLLATDAAGEGLNLQAAHLMVNYDLPWNPNRIEQRFGRIHRIGQTEVCRLWNLVAANTREGEVFTRLLQKIEEQRKAYGGKVFDVLGAAFDETPLRELLIEAIRYGDLPETRAKMEQVIDDSVAHGLKELLEERALAHDAMQRRRPGPAAAADGGGPRPPAATALHRVAPSAPPSQRLGGRLARRERGRYEITHVPAAVRAVTKHGPIATRYERVTFELDRIDVDGKPRADLLAPGHPLHDAVAELTIARSGPHARPRHRPGLTGGRGAEPAGRRRRGGRRRRPGSRSPAGSATPTSTPRARSRRPARRRTSTASPPRRTPAVAAATNCRGSREAEAQAASWIIGHQLKDYLAEVTPRRHAELNATREQVDQRLAHESTGSSARRWRPRRRSRPARSRRRAPTASCARHRTSRPAAKPVWRCWTSRPSWPPSRPAS